MEVIDMTTIVDIAEEMIKVQRQMTLLKSKRKKTQEDVEEIFILNRYYSILLTDYLSKSKNY